MVGVAVAVVAAAVAAAAAVVAGGGVVVAVVEGMVVIARTQTWVQTGVLWNNTLGSLMQEKMTIKSDSIRDMLYAFSAGGFSPQTLDPDQLDCAEALEQPGPLYPTSHFRKEISIFS